MSGQPVPHQVSRNADETTVTTSAVVVSIHSNGTVRFATLGGVPLVTELSHELEANHSTMVWDSPADEAINGLGQHNFGFIDYSGAPIPLTQYNLWAAVPFFVSTRGFGLLWDT